MAAMAEAVPTSLRTATAWHLPRDGNDELRSKYVMPSATMPLSLRRSFVQTTTTENLHRFELHASGKPVHAIPSTEEYKILTSWARTRSAVHLYDVVASGSKWALDMVPFAAGPNWSSDVLVF